MNTYSQAVNDIRTYSELKQNELDCVAIAARNSHIQMLRKAPFFNIDNHLEGLATLVSNKIECGREDGYPQVSLPKEVLEVLRAANRAGLIQFSLGLLEFYPDFSGVSNHLDEFYPDYKAWRAAVDYRETQTWRSL